MRKNRIMISFVVLFTVLGAVIISLPIASRFLPNHGLQSGKLKPCQATTNCVCSEEFSNNNLEPIQLEPGLAGVVWGQLKAVVITSGGEVQYEEDNYFRAIFTTPLMRYIDDFEARLDVSENVIHLRSASRVGRKDFGVNKKRTDEILEKLAQADVVKSQ